MTSHLINRVTVLGTGLIGGSFALALPIAATLDLLPEIARHAPPHVLVTDACSTKVRIAQAADELFPGEEGPLFLGGHPMAGRELPGIAHADADLFRENTYALIAKSSEPVLAGFQARSSSLANESGSSHDPPLSAFVKILEKIGARPLWLGAQQHDYAVGLASHLPQLA